MSNSNKYMRVYMRKQYRIRRKEAIYRLGGKCIKCDSIKNLELDHKDRSTKTCEPARMMRLSRERFEVELRLLQILCRLHHSEKTTLELGRKIARGTHGTLSSYRYCHCEKCKEAKRNHNRLYSQTVRHRALNTKDAGSTPARVTTL